MKHAKKKQFLDQIHEVPIVSSVCKQLGISRQTYYRWRKEDEEFRDSADRYLGIGRESINDLAESTLINAIKDGDLGSAKFWLQNNKRNYLKPRPRNFVLDVSDVKKKHGNQITFVNLSYDPTDTTGEE